MRRILGWALNAAAAAGLVLVTIVFVYALQARRQADLQPWHTLVPQLEMTAADIGPDFSLAEYRAREDALFDETRTLLESAIPTEEQMPGNRYWEGSPDHQWNFPTDWNRTFELKPTQPSGGALLLHGLTDSPYSLRALIVKHQLDALEDPALTRADRIILLSPMIGISPAAALSRVLDSLSFIPYFGKSAWTDVQPEFNPFKYNSFPLNGAIQTRALTVAIATRIERLKADLPEYHRYWPFSPCSMPR